MKIPFKVIDFIFYCSVWLVSGWGIYVGMQWGFDYLLYPDWLGQTLAFIMAFTGGLFLAEAVGEFQGSKKDWAALREALQHFAYLFATLLVFCGLTLGGYLLVSPYFEAENSKTVFAFSGMLSLVGVFLGIGFFVDRYERPSLPPDIIE